MRQDLTTESRIYDGSLLEDCASIVELGVQLQAMRDEPAPPNIFDVARARNAAEAKAGVCRCNAYGFPHRKNGGKCEGEKVCTCKPEVDPYATGDSWYSRVMDCTCGAND